MYHEVCCVVHTPIVYYDSASYGGARQVDRCVEVELTPLALFQSTSRESVEL